MNFAKVYNDSLKAVKDHVEEETIDSAQFILSDEKQQWMQNQFTRRLFDFLHLTRNALLEDCVTCVDDKRKVRARLHKAKQIKEIIEYASRIGTTESTASK